MSDVRTSSTDRLNDASLSVSRTTLIALVLPPARLTAPTPSIVSSRSLIRLRAISVTSRKSRRPLTAMVITGIEAVSNLLTTGVSVASGRLARMVWILSRTSCVPTSPFFARLNWTVTVEIPSLVVDRSSSIPLTVLTMSSIGFVTDASISSTLAPESTVVTVQTGKSTFGNWSTPRLP